MVTFSFISHFHVLTSNNAVRFSVFNYFKKSLKNKDPASVISINEGTNVDTKMKKLDMLSVIKMNFYK